MLRLMPKSKTSKRNYNNRTRRESIDKSKQAIVEALIALLVENRGGEVSFRDISKKAGVSERSIYRFFSDKAALHEEMDHYLASYIEASVDQLKHLNVAEFAKNAFLLFDKHAPLVLAYIFSPFGQELRKIFRLKLNKLIRSKILKEKKIIASKAVEKKIAVVCSLINAKIWSDLNTDYGYTGAELGDTVLWAVNRLIEDI